MGVREEIRRARTGVILQRKFAVRFLDVFGRCFVAEAQHRVRVDTGRSIAYSILEAVVLGVVGVVIHDVVFFLTARHCA